MTTTHRSERFDPFDPEVVRAMGLAFDNAWESLKACGNAYAAPSQAESTREALALSIVGIAQCGERDANRLRERALACLADALERKRA